MSPAWDSPPATRVPKYQPGTQASCGRNPKSYIILDPHQVSSIAYILALARSRRIPARDSGSVRDPKGEAVWDAGPISNVSSLGLPPSHEGP